ncbi:MAG: hypothetical protein JNL72_11120 [Flavipsychrobacter sp.]|nr:hypothetical protein [Flavipsychrobacter sp.]
MKAVFLLGLLLFIHPAGAQVRVSFLTSNDSTLAIFGSGKDNRIRLSGMPADAEVTVSNGRITSLGRNEYMVHQLGDARECELKIVYQGMVLSRQNVKVVRTKYSGTSFNPRMEVMFNKTTNKLEVVGNTDCQVAGFMYSILPQRRPLYGPYMLSARVWVCGFEDRPIPPFEVRARQAYEQLSQAMQEIRAGNGGKMKLFFQEILVRCPCCPGTFFPATSDSFIVTME